jgi:hypothetical protein
MTMAAKLFSQDKITLQNGEVKSGKIAGITDTNRTLFGSKYGKKIVALDFNLELPCIWTAKNGSYLYQKISSRLLS